MAKTTVARPAYTDSCIRLADFAANAHLSVETVLHFASKGRLQIFVRSLVPSLMCVSVDLCSLDVARDDSVCDAPPGLFEAPVLSLQPTELFGL